MTEVPRRIDRYEVIRPIGQGGAAVVYLARQLDLDRLVALKELRMFQSANDPELAERFLREAQLAGSMSHPNIVTVYEYFKHEDTPYIAMEYLESGSLRPSVGSLSLAQIAGVLEGVLAALDHAEGHGIVHRDLKPENLLITDQGQIKVTDFGIAKARTMYTDAHLTGSGVTVGTPAYMAPEQAMGHEVGAYTDLYSVGLITYELLVGRVPFDDTDEPVAIILRHVNEQIPPAHTVDPSVDRGVSDWIDRLLLKEPSERTQTAEQAWDELEEVVLRLLGSRWRREARLVPRTEQPNGSPLTPAPFTRTDLKTPIPRATSDEFQSFAWGSAEAAPPSPVPSPPPVPNTAKSRARAAPPVTRRERKGHLSRRSPGQSRVVPIPGVHAATRIELHPAFTYIHGPLDESAVVPLLGNEDIVENVVKRVVHSQSGSLLVTGFRGVGKTTVVRRALARIADGAGDVEVVPVILNVAQERTTTQVLFNIMRRLYDHIKEHRISDRLDTALRDDLELAYKRTSIALTHTHHSGIERNWGVDLGAGFSGAIPRITGSKKTKDALDTQGAYHDYLDADVEHDFEHIVARLSGNTVLPSSRDSRGRRIRLARRKLTLKPWKGHLVVVLDELDKLTGKPGGDDAVRDLVMGLKTLLTTSGAHFLFVAGPDLHETAVQDRMRGTGVFESVFAQIVYVPCIWSAEERLLDVMIPDTASRQSPQVAALRDYLAFWGRGRPASLLRAFETFIRWEGDKPYLHLDEHAMTEITFWAGIGAVTRAFVEERIDTTMRMLEVDRWRTHVYLAVEWILNSRASFSVDDLVAHAAQEKVAPLLALEQEELSELVARLAASKFIRQVGGGTLIDQPYYEDAVQPPVYEVSDTSESAIRELDAEQSAGGDDRSPASSLDAMPFAGAVGQTIDNGRYLLLAELDRTGTGRVYRALDKRTDMDVAVKVFDLPSLRCDEHMRARILRESEIALRLDHPRIVRTHDTFSEPDGRLAIVMNLVPGRSLKHELKSIGKLSPVASVQLGCDILDALYYLERQGLARLDLRPSTIMLDEALKPTIVNLGLVKHVNARADAGTTRAGTVVGTPAYAAPEQLAGEPVDIRADLYSLGLILYEAITGHRVRQQGSAATMMHSARDAEVDLSVLHVSSSLRDVLSKTLERSPDRRFESAARMLEALTATPEQQG